MARHTINPFGACRRFYASDSEVGCGRRVSAVSTSVTGMCEDWRTSVSILDLFFRHSAEKLNDILRRSMKVDDASLFQRNNRGRSPWIIVQKQAVLTTKRFW